MGDKMTGDPSVFQDSFQMIVKQNIEDFEMEKDEAVADALEQLKAQGVDTRFIVTDERAASVPAQLSELSALAAEAELSEPQLTRLAELLEAVRQFCAAGLPERVLAGRRGAYPALRACLRAGRPEAAALRALAALQDGQPDLFAADDCALLLRLLDARPAETLPWATAVTLRHEENRQALAEAGLLARLAARLADPAARRDQLPALLTLLRQMTLDDDVRVPYGRAHQHACQLVTEHAALDTLLALLKGAAEDAALAAEVLHAATKLCVRQEFCEQFAESGGVETMLDVMRANPDKVSLVGRSFFLIRTLAGSDKVKGHIMKAGAAETIVTTLDTLKTKTSVSEAAFAAIGALTLRSETNAGALAQAGAVPVMVSAMELHPTQPKTQKLACMAIRNMASRSPELRPAFREHGAEKLINAALQSHGPVLDAEARAALRDLDCKVTLKEEWTGHGGALTTGLIKVPEQPSA
ncbi:armadillo repeat-containing protein 6-like [Amphibalanus amphitrite]|uniref:armadillo repeat-containing protein 6-like n=1 Tax=Amphibalanus amphitrite TaxID=1232801 RepID=UPI001C91C7EE|nr:armadillo repeat-containing protein 6-like [Amphibalanus amphitrite]XP_043233027.1 armadillo repeat-containing protein 6-like [Amphibalanus amphitrite]